MNYVLLNKNIPVFVFQFNDDYRISKILKEENISYAPYGLIQQGAIDIFRLNDWWQNRSIPASRKNLTLLLEKYNISNKFELIKRSYGLSLSDQYWIKPENLDIEWKQVNFFDNEFSDDIGKILFESYHSKNIQFNSPDNTSDGNLPKAWKIIDNKRVLLKKGSEPFFQEPFNEVIASLIAEKLNIPHAQTKLMNNGGEFYSASEDFINSDSELVSANQLLSSVRKPKHISNYQALKEILEKENIHSFVSDMNSMLILDYIINNEDRHLRNFGYIRNVETLKFEKMAPLYDNGTSLWYANIDGQIGIKKEVKPFNSNIDKQLKYITTFREFPLEQLKNIEDPIEDILKQNSLLTSDRIKAITQQIRKRIDFLQLKKSMEEEISVNVNSNS